MKRIFAFLLVLVMTAGFLPGIALADSDGQADPTVFEWKVFPEGTDANVTIMGTGGQVLKLDIGMDGGMLSQAESAELDFNYRVAHNSGRRVLAWTDLSGAGDEITDFTFATSARIDAGKVSVSDVITSGANSAKVKLPKALLYDEAEGKTAAALYVLMCTDEGANGKDTDQFTVEGNQRGANGRKGVNGIDLDREFDIIDTAKLTVEIDPTAFTWRVFPAGANVNFLGDDSNLLKLSDVGVDPSVLLGGKGGALEFTYRVAHNSGRRILAWTDLSGAADEVGDLSFATTANLAAGKVAVSDVLPSGTDFASVTMPKELLGDTATGKTAAEIYVLLAVDKGAEGLDDAYTDAATNQRGGVGRNGVNGIDLEKEFDIFGSVKLNVNYVSFASRISLTPGSDAAQMNFAWLTEKGSAAKAVVQLAKKADVVNGVMPKDAVSFNGRTAAGTLEFDTNKATVTGLAANTEYAYRVGDGTEWSAVYNFKTGDPDGAYSVIAVADPQIGNAKEGEAWKTTLEKAVAKAGNASFMLSAGDYADKSNSMEQWDMVTAPKVLRSLPVATAIGNHDTFDFLGEPNEQIGLMPIHFNWPNHTILNVTEGDKPFMRAGGDYYFNYGSTLYIVINTNVKDIEVHRDFMKKAVASNPNAVWTVALFHHDIYGTGDHAGTAYQDAQRMQPEWSPFLDEFGVDIAINGHDHVYARSLFMKGNEIQNDQMPATMDPLGLNIRKANPGAYVLPEGIQYMALSAAGCEKMYAPEYQDWVAYTHGMLGVPEYSVMTVDGDTLTFTSYRSDTDAVTDSITLRKTATSEDLEKLIPDCEALQSNANITGGWDAFQAAIAAGKKALESSDGIHDAYVALYDAYYAIQVNTDKAALKALIADVTDTLASAIEGMWSGQYPEGSKAVLKAVLDKETAAYTDRLSDQAAVDAAAAALSAAFKTFKDLASALDIPWVGVHKIGAAGVSEVELVGWMAGDVQIAYVTKQEFAKDNLGGKRSDPVDGPANGLGGRGPSESNITKTHIGEWIRYELNVEKDGMYKAALGAANGSGKAQTILLRNADRDTLCAFIVPEDAALPAGGWAEAPMIAADKEFYLPAGSYIVELYFINDGVGISVSSAANVAFPNDAGNVAYPDGADVDILTLERVGDGTPPVIEKDPSIFVLPLPPTSIQGAPARQKGWASEGYVDDQGTVVTGISLEVFMAAKALVLEVAARPASTNIQLHLIPEGDGSIWAANESTPQNTPALVMDTLYSDGKLTFPLDEMLGYDAWSKSQDQCMIDVSYYSYGWDDMNVMKAYLIVDPALMPDETEKPPVTPDPGPAPVPTTPDPDPAPTTPGSTAALKTTDGLVSVIPPSPVVVTAADGSRTVKDLAYTVQNGETLWSVAFNYYGSMGSAAVNKIWNANKAYFDKTKGALEAGAVIILPGAGLIAPVTQGSLDTAAGVYLVKAGDTLADIAAKYYGDAKEWKKIYEANKDRVKMAGNSPMIYEKQWLVIPE
ncbi:MAG: fibronectin type III domain-containing protein [Oscillospiraceae bacterium]|jgi:LysM repeat protein|nr:fibronectin type III domain-containing protein [Oscillospiraceae bacterium]